MKILSARQIRELDAYTIKNEPISSVDLMERAACAAAERIFTRFPTSDFKIFCGPGNNGGDGLVVARILLQKKKRVSVFVVRSSAYSGDFKVNENRLESLTSITYIESSDDFPQLTSNDRVVDALFGSGLNRAPQGIFARLIAHLNASEAAIISIDMPSGLFCDQHTPQQEVIQASLTLTFQLPKLAFLLPENSEWVGEFERIDIGLKKEGIEKAETPYFFTEHIKGQLKKRPRFSHKGTFGKALILAGKYGSVGAAVLAVRACYRSGAGLVYAYIPECGYAIMQISAPEALTFTDPDPKRLTDIPDLSGFSSIAIGPGINEDDAGRQVVRKLLETAEVPLVIDAGALNCIAKDSSLRKSIPSFSILTPHPGEFERLAGKSENDFERLDKLKALSSEWQSIVVLKGAFTAIAFPGGQVYFNSTGNPGMATGGSGDVLTGTLAGLLAQGYDPKTAAILGVYMHGWAADVAAKRTGMAALIASDIIERLKDFYVEFEESADHHQS